MEEPETERFQHLESSFPTNAVEWQVISERAVEEWQVISDGAVEKWGDLRAGNGEVERMPETEPNLRLTSKRRVETVELRNHTQVNQTQGRGHKTRSMVQHPVGSTKFQARRCRGAEAQMQLQS